MVCSSLAETCSWVFGILSNLDLKILSMACACDMYGIFGLAHPKQ